MSPRVALYGHDTIGLGHLRRNLTLARSLSSLPDRPDVLIVSGAAPEAMSFPLPDGVDVLAVPGVAKDQAGRYTSRQLSMGLDDVVRIRGAVIAAGLDEFSPDLMVVDKLPLGLAGELEPALRRLRGGHGTRIVLGLRDVLDEAPVARADWRTGRMSEAVRAFFDEIWVYGDPTVHDVAESCGIPPTLRSRVRFTGYLSATGTEACRRPPMLDDGQAYVICTVGGGADGAGVAIAFASAPMPPGVVGIVVTGPQMPADQRAVLERRAARRQDMVVVPFHPDVGAWVGSARAAVTMGGYNSMTEVLGTTTPALVVPRSRPRAEQLVRARAMAAKGLIDVVEEAGATPAALGRWIHDTVTRPRPLRRGVDLDGLSRVRAFAKALVREDIVHDVAV